MGWGRMKRGWLGVALAVMAGPTAHAAADELALNCARPNSRAARAICQQPVLVAADRDLAELTRELQQRAAAGAAVATQHRDWIRRRDRMCAPALSAECLDIAYTEREAYLRAQLASAPPVAGTSAAPVEAPVAATPPTTPPHQPAPVPVASMPAALAEATIRPALPVIPPPPVLSFAARLTAAPCGMVGSTALRGMGWAPGQAPFGLPFEQWSKPDYTALLRRSAECQAANIDSPRNLQAMAGILLYLQRSAPDEPAAPPPVLTAARPVQAAARPATPVTSWPGPDAAAPPLPLNCTDPALLQDVSFTYQSTPEVSGGAPLLRMYDPRPYTDVIMEAYGATPALQAEYRMLQRYMAPVPQCLVNVTTSTGEAVLSYRLYAEGGRTLIEVQRVP